MSVCWGSYITPGVTERDWGCWPRKREAAETPPDILLACLERDWYPLLVCVLSYAVHIGKAIHTAVPAV
jgi:hypothetical protein